jgi:hypothetical protein
MYTNKKKNHLASVSHRASGHQNSTFPLHGDGNEYILFIWSSSRDQHNISCDEKRRHGAFEEADDLDRPETVTV